MAIQNHSKRVYVRGTMDVSAVGVEGAGRPQPIDSEWLRSLRRTIVDVTVPSQSIADDVIDKVFDDAMVEVIHRYFDRLAVPYAVTWAAKQMSEALFAACQGPDTGTTYGPSWHADPVPQQVTMDVCARSTLKIVLVERPPTPEVEEDDLDLTRSSLSGSRRFASRGRLIRQPTNVPVKRKPVRNLSSQALSEDRGRSNGSSPTRSCVSDEDEIARHSSDGSSTSTGDAMDVLSSSTCQAFKLQPSPSNLFPSTCAPSEEGEAAVEVAPVDRAHSIERQRALHLERQLEDLLRQQEAAASHNKSTGQKQGAPKPPQFIVDSVSGKIHMVKPLDMRPNGEGVHYALHGGGASRPPSINADGLSPASAASPTSPRGAPRRKAKNAPTEYYREDSGQQMICAIKNPALGVGVRDAEKERRNQLQPGAFGEGRVSKRTFVHLQQSASHRLSSSEGFREYFPGGNFTATVTPLPSSMSPIEASPAWSSGGAEALSGMSVLNLSSGDQPMRSSLLDNTDDGVGLSLHEQYDQLLSDRVAVGKGNQRRNHVGRPHHLGHIPPRAEVLDKRAAQPPPSSGPLKHGIATLPVRRPDLLPPLASSSSSADPSAAPDGGRTSPPLTDNNTTASAYHQFVALQKEKDAPHFKPGKAGGHANTSSVQRKDALSFLSEQEDIASRRRTTRVLLPSSEASQ